MKKNFVTSILAIVVATSAAFASTNPIKTVKVDTEKSTINWVGKKITGKHMGTISLKEGILEMDGDQLVGGKFVVDMTTINVTDLEAGKGKEKLEGHLNSDDFFGVANFPTATFEITKAVPSGDGYSVVGDLTIKGVTEQVKVNLRMNGHTATTTLMVDRTKFGIRYGSASFFNNLKDKAINDAFELHVNLVF